MIIDGFLRRFNEFRSHIDNLDFSGEINPVDNTLYPGISTEIPEEIREEILSKIGEMKGSSPENVTMFMRLSTYGVTAPYPAHTDAIMSRNTFMLYLNRDGDCQGGTSFVRHIDTGMDSQPRSEEEFLAWERDNKDYSAWEITKMNDMAPNRAVVFDSSIMHRAEPPEGFGDNAENGRLVLVCFYD